MKIQIPSDVNSCSLQQLGQWSKLSEEVRGVPEFETLDFKIKVFSIFTGVKYDKIRSMSFSDISKIYKDIMTMLSKHEPKEPSPRIKVGDKHFNFELDFTKVSAGQVIDIKLLDDIHLDAARVMAILHIEDGFVYSQTNEREVVLNPTSDRAKLFEESFPGEQYLNVMNFFLNYYRELKIISIIKKTTEQRIQMTKIQKELKTETNSRNGIFGLKIFKRSRKPINQRRIK